mgnify:CR=1 FL=1
MRIDGFLSLQGVFQLTLQLCLLEKLLRVEMIITDVAVLDAIDP